MTPLVSIDDLCVNLGGNRILRHFGAQLPEAKLRR